MFYTINRLKFWRYLQGGFLYRVQLRTRKAIKILMAKIIGVFIHVELYTQYGETILPTLKNRITDIFDYGS